MREAHFDVHQAEHERAVEAQLCAFNTAFAELGLRFRWDAQTLTSLAAIEGERARIIAYLEAHQGHLLTAYSAAFLSEAILAKKTAHTPHALPTLPAARRAPLVPQGSSLPTHFCDDDPGLPALAGA